MSSTLQKGKVIIIVAPSGAGKSTIAQKVMSEFPEVTFSVSATTREKRDHEEDGIHYHFLSQEEFQQHIEDGHFLEWEEVFDGMYYGTLRSAVECQLNKGYFVLLDVEVNGALNVKRIYGDECLDVFIKPPSLEALKERLIKRDTETEESLAYRLQRAEKELQLADRFTHVVVNDNLETAVSEVKKLVSDFIHN